MAAGDNRGHGGNAGYDDQVDAYYSWDSKVPNHKNLAPGDAIALWDKERLLGVSVIEEITREPGQKVLSRCPACRTTRISARKTATPRFRCMKCSHEFEEADSELVDVERYTARYDAAWTWLDGLLDESEIRPLALHKGDINAMRPLDWQALQAALAQKNADRAVERIASRVDLTWPTTAHPDVDFTHGHTQALVRVRRGQRKFREHLLAAQGTSCAFTGSAPERVLEAGHLYSYAQLGTHYEHGGLMLRRDIHRLFDDGLLAVRPDRLSIDVSDSLAQHPQYEALHGRALSLDVRPEQVHWLRQHWNEHRVA